MLQIRVQSERDSIALPPSSVLPTSPGSPGLNLLLSPSGAVRAGLHHTPTLLCPSALPPPVSLALPWCCRLQVQSERDSITRPLSSVLSYLPRPPWPYPGAVAFRCSQSGTPSHAHPTLSYPTSPGLPGLTLVLSPSGAVRAGLHHTPTLLCPTLPPPVSLVLSPSGAVRAGLHHTPTLLCPTLPPPVSLALPWCCRLQVQSERDFITRPPSSVLPYLPRSPWPYPGAVAFRRLDRSAVSGWGFAFPE